MICQVCQGKGEVVKSFLWLFTRRRPCAKCGGTGRLDAPQTRDTRSPARDRSPDDYYTSVPDSYAASSSGPSDSAFALGSGGRSGGGGGGAGWGDEREPRDASRAESEGPLIVDPFAAETSAGGTSEAMCAEASDGSGADSGADSSGAGGGTAY